MKRFLAMLLAFCMVFSFDVSVFAAEETEEPQATPLLLHYDFDEAEGTEVLDSVNHYNGELAGAAGWTNGVVDGAVSLPGGKEDYISIPTEVFTQSEDISIVAWVNASEIQVWSSLLTVGSGSTNYTVIALQGTPGNVECGLTMATMVNGGVEQRVKAPAGTYPKAGEWAMLTFTQSGNIAKIYMNETLVAETDAMNATIKQVVEADEASTARLGSNIMFNDPSMKGVIDDLKIYGGALTQEEITALATTGEPGETLIKEEIDAAADSFTLDDTSAVSSDLMLPQSIGSRVKIRWESDKEEFLKSDGSVMIPTESQGNQEVTLTGTFYCENSEYTRTIQIPVTILAISDEEKEASVLLHYEMKEGEGTTVTDSKNSYHGTLVGDTAWVKGLNGSAVELYRDDDYILMPREAFMQSEEISISMWVKPNKVENWTALLVAGDSENNYAIMAAKGNPFGESVGLTMAIKQDGGTEYRIAAESGVSIPANEWSLVTYTQKGTKASLLINGKMVAQMNEMNASIKGVLEASSEADVRIGNNRMFPDPGLDGAISEVKVSSRAISANEDREEVEAKREAIAKLALQDAADSVDLGDLSDVREDLQLEKTAANGVQITWSSSKPQFITSEGKVTLPTAEQGDQEVLLTAVFSSEEVEETITKTFTATLLALTDERIVSRSADYVKRYVDYIINDGYELLTSEELGCDIEWTLTEGEAAISDGKVVKTDQSAERQPIKLKAILSKGQETAEVTFENVTLIDEYAGYILSFFGGADNQQKLHLGYSYDGVNWEKLNEGNTVIWTEIGNGTVRDPYIMRKKDGSFCVVATQGWDTPQIYLWDSEDLVTYTNERLKTVAYEGVAGLTGARAWAPEASYDPIKDEYIVYWSDPSANNGNGCTYANTSKDLEEFSQPFVLFDAGYSIIDANIIKWKGSYYMVFKDERGNNEDGGGGKTIQMAKSDSLEPGTFKQYTGPITETLVEGPFMFKVNGEETWYHYFDYFKEHKFGLSVTHDLDSGEWEFLGKSSTMPTENVQHGGVIAVTQKELDRILEGYDVTETVTEIAEPDEVTAEIGTAFEDLDLPETVEITVKAGKITVPVTWDSSAYHPETAGTYTITGKIADRYVLADGVLPVIKVTVASMENLDTSELEKALQEVPQDLSGYTEKSTAVLKSITEAAKEMLARDDLTSEDQALLDQLAESVRLAIAGLEEIKEEPIGKPADLNALKEAVESVPKDLSGYTQKSVETLRSVLNTANVLLSRTDLEEKDQAVIDQVTESVRRAIAGLETEGTGNEPAAEDVKVGDVYKIGRLKYKVTGISKSNRTVMVTAPTKKTYKKLTIPSTVKIKNHTYQVTAVGSNAFKNNRNLTSVSIGKNVTRIGAKAFYGTKKLKKLTIKSKQLQTVGKRAVLRSNKKLTVKVPSSKVKSYKKLFKNKGLAKIKVTK